MSDITFLLGLFTHFINNVLGHKCYSNMQNLSTSLHDWLLRTSAIIVISSARGILIPVSHISPPRFYRMTWLSEIMWSTLALKSVRKEQEKFLQGTSLGQQLWYKGARYPRLKHLNIHAMSRQHCMCVTTLAANSHRSSLLVGYLETYLRRIEHWLWDWRIAINACNSTAVLFAKTVRHPNPKAETSSDFRKASRVVWNCTVSWSSLIHGWPGQCIPTR